MARPKKIAKELQEIITKVESVAENPPESPPAPVKKKRVPPAAWKKGQSGNPKGRPKGSKNRKTIIDAAIQTALVNRLEKDAIAIYEKAVELAVGGDKSMIRMFMDRLLPEISSVGSKDIGKNISAIQIVVNPVEPREDAQVIEAELLPSPESESDD